MFEKWFMMLYKYFFESNYALYLDDVYNSIPMHKNIVGRSINYPKTFDVYCKTPLSMQDKNFTMCFDYIEIFQKNPNITTCSQVFKNGHSYKSTYSPVFHCTPDICLRVRPGVNPIDFITDDIFVVKCKNQQMISNVVERVFDVKIMCACACVGACVGVEEETHHMMKGIGLKIVLNSFHDLKILPDNMEYVINVFDTNNNHTCFSLIKHHGWVFIFYPNSGTYFIDDYEEIQIITGIVLCPSTNVYIWNVRKPYSYPIRDFYNCTFKDVRKIYGNMKSKTNYKNYVLKITVCWLLKYSKYFVSGWVMLSNWKNCLLWRLMAWSKILFYKCLFNKNK